MNLSEFIIQGSGEVAPPTEDFWVAVQHLPCETFIFGDGPDDPDELGADRLMQLIEAHSCPPEVKQ